MNNFEFCSPTDFVFGKGVATQVGPKLKALGATCVMVQYGGGSVVRNGILETVTKSLDEAGLKYIVKGGVRANPEVTFVREAIVEAREAGVDFLFAVGGGSVMDSCKATAAGLCHDGDVWDLFVKKDGAPVYPIDECLPVGMVLTIPAAGSEGSDSMVITNEELGMKSGRGAEALRSKVSFMDPTYTFTLSPEQTAAGITDMFAHLLERFFSETGNVPITDNLNLSIMKTIRACAPRVLENPEDYEARANIMWAATLAHNGLAGMGRAGDWACHAIEHELSAIDASIPHGAGLAVIFPAWMQYVYKENPERFVLYGQEVFGISRTDDVEADALRAIEATQLFFISLGMPARLADFNIHEEDIEGMIPTLIANKGEIFGSFKKIGADDARAIYRIAL